MTKVIDIVWETDGVDANLPTEVELPSCIEEDNYDAIEDFLSNTYGFLVLNYFIGQ